MRLWNAGHTYRTPPEDTIWRRWLQDQTDIPPRTRRTLIPPETETLINLRLAFKAVLLTARTLSEPQSSSRTSPGATVPLGGAGLGSPGAAEAGAGGVSRVEASAPLG